MSKDTIWSDFRAQEDKKCHCFPFFPFCLPWGDVGGRRRKGRQKVIRLDGITDLMGMSLSKLLEFVMDREDLVLWIVGPQIFRHDWATEGNWLNWWDLMLWSEFLSYWVFCLLLHSSPLPTSRGNVVPLLFLPLEQLSHTYMSLLIFQPTVLIPAYNSPSMAYLRMCSA